MCGCPAGPGISQVGLLAGLVGLAAFKYMWTLQAVMGASSGVHWAGLGLGEAFCLDTRAGLRGLCECPLLPLQVPDQH